MLCKFNKYGYLFGHYFFFLFIFTTFVLLLIFIFIDFRVYDIFFLCIYADLWTHLISSLNFLGELFGFWGQVSRTIDWPLKSFGL